jgi:hypothetical protein
VVLGFICAHNVFAATKKAEITLQLTVNPVLYSGFKDGQILIENNTNEEISVYEDCHLIYSGNPSSSTNDLRLLNYSSYSFFTVIPAI